MRLSSPLPQILPKECTKAARIFQSFATDNGLDGLIPRHVLERAQGFAFLTVVKAGFILSGRAGSGLVIARLDDDTWSAPSAIGTAGMGIGSQAGAELTEFLFVLNSKSAVRSFMSAGAITLGGSLSLAVGPVGRTGEASGSLNTGGRVAAIYTYSKTKGLFGGVSIEGSVIAERQEANCLAYESSVTAQMLLSGVVPVPQWADGLIKTIESVTGTSGTPKWIRERGPEYLEEYAFGGMGSPDSIMKKKKGTPKLEFPPKSWGSPKTGGSYFDEWDKDRNVTSPTRSGKSTPGVKDKERDLIDVSPGLNSKPGKSPLHNMTSPFDTTNADIYIPTEHIKSPFDTSALRRSSSSGRPKPVRTESETSLKMKSRAAQLSNRLEGDISAFSKLALRTPPATQPAQPSLIDYFDDEHPIHHSPPRDEPDPNLPYHLQEVHVNLDRTKVSLPSPKNGGYIKPTLLRKSSSKQGLQRKYTDTDSEEEEALPQHRRAPSQKFKAQLKEPLDPECVGRAIVRFDFEAVEPGDLAMHKGDIVLILERSNSIEDWWRGKIGNRVGNFPANFVEVVGAESHGLDPFDQL